MASTISIRAIFIDNVTKGFLVERDDVYMHKMLGNRLPLREGEVVAYYDGCRVYLVAEENDLLAVQCSKEQTEAILVALPEC